jgi:hypothetical protein
VLRRPHLVVGLVSSATVAFEILLVRWFAVATFHHFAYLAIGVAMLGLAAGGTIGVVRGPRADAGARRWLEASALVTGATLLALPLVIQAIDVDPAQLPWDRSQWLVLALLDAMLALPFAAGALVVLSGLELEQDRPGALYGASFLGSAVGAAAAVVVLFLLPPHRAIAAPAVIAAVAALGAPGAPRAFRAITGLLAAATIVVLSSGWLEPPRSPYKALPQVQAFPGARTVGERHGPTGVVTAVAAPAFRFAPGLSLGYGGAVPSQIGLFVDGAVSGAYPASTVDREEVERMLDWLPSAAPYVLRQGTVLVIDPGGRLEVDNALAHGATAVTVVETVRDVAVFATRELPTSVDVRWLVAEPRAVLARSAGRFDVITLGPSGGLGGEAAGLYALDADFLHTADGYAACLDALAPGGVLSITRWLSVPARGSVRTILTAADALRRAGQPDPRGRLLGIRSWGTLTVLVSPDGFDAAMRTRLEAWATERLFDVVRPGGGLAVGEPFNQSSDPALRDAWRALAQGGQASERFAAQYPFDVAPATDGRPYPQHFLSVGALATLLESGSGEWLPFAEWGYLTALATLVVSAIVGSVLLLGPAVLPRHLRRRPPPRTIGYFAAIGLGFMLIEIAAIQILGLLLGHPVYAVTAVLGALLVGSGFGSAFTDRLWGPTALPPLAIAVLAALLAAGLLPATHALLSADGAVRWGAAVTAVLGLGFLMGQPFPLGLAALARRDRARVAWAWAANGVASVVAAPLASIVGIEWGTPTLLAGGAGCYALAGTLLATQRPADREQVSTAGGSRPR